MPVTGSSYDPSPNNSDPDALGDFGDISSPVIPPNQLQRVPGEHIRRQGNGGGHRHRLRNVLIIIFVILVMLAGVCGFLAYRIYRQAQAVGDQERAAVAILAEAGNIDDARGASAFAGKLPALRDHTGEARRIAHQPLWNLAARMPVYGNDITTVQGMTAVMDHVATDALPPLAKTVHSLMTADLTAGGSQLNLKPVENAQQGFTRANDSISEQAARLDTLPEPRLTQVREAYDLSREQLDAAGRQISGVTTSLRVLPTFLGAHGARNYLLVAQTTSESRSSGGLIGSIGTMNARDGMITVGEFHPNTEFNLSGVLTSQEEQVFRTLEVTTDPRNAAVLPEFPHMAQIVNKTWQASPYASPVDGLITVDPVFIQTMVGINGDVTLDNGMKLTGSNTAEFLLNGLYQRIPVPQQNAYFNYVVRSAMTTMFSHMTLHKLTNMSTAMSSLTRNRHLYVFSYHANEAADFQGAGMARGTPSSESHPETGLYLTEMKSSKLDWYIHRRTTITREGCNTTGARRYRMTVQLTNTIPASVIASGNTYITGNDDKYGPAGTAGQAALFYPPRGGSISDLSLKGGSARPGQVTIDGSRVWLSKANLKPGGTLTYSFTVTTSAKAETDLQLDQTPMGWDDPGVTYNGANCQTNH